MTNSEIFKNFIKIAEEKSLARKDQDEASKEIHKNKNRAGSTSIEQIAKLYNIKPDSPKEMEYENNIMEVAHPTTTVIAPAYDRLNGMVGNEIEKQNITLNKINRIPTGQLHNKKYANDLSLSLIRIANSLDGKNTKLTRLADTSLQQIKLGFPILVPMVITVGALYFFNHCKATNHGFDINHKNLIESIDDLLNDSASDASALYGAGTGYTYKESFKSMLKEFKSYLENIKKSYKKVETLLSEIEQPKDKTDIEELSKLAEDPETKTAVAAYQEFAVDFDDVNVYVRKVLANFSNDDYKKRQIADKALVQNWIDAVPGLHGGSGFFVDDFDDVKQNLEAYWSTIQNTAKILGQAKSIQESFAKELEEAKSSELPEDPSKVEETDSLGNTLFESLKQFKFPWDTK